MTRLRYLDQAKGLGILCIVFLHYEQGVISGELNTFIGSFMITIFYIVAGWVMAMKDSKMSTKELAKRRLRSLGLPYLYWTGIILLFDCLLWVFGYYDTYFIARETYKSIMLRGIGTLWFLPALFFGEIGWNWLRKRKWIWWIVSLIIITIYHYYYGQFFAIHSTSTWKIIQAPFYTISNALSAIFHVAVGYFAYKILNNKIESKFSTVLIGLLLIVVGYITANYLHFIIGIKAASLFWSYFAPNLGPLGFLYLFIGIEHTPVLNYFDYWGRNSLSLMVTHYSIVQVLITIFITQCLHLQFYGWTTIWAFIASMPIQDGITEIINRKAKYLINVQ